MKQSRTLISLVTTCGALFGASCALPVGDEPVEEVTGESQASTAAGDHAKVDVCFNDKVKHVSPKEADALVKRGGYRGPCDVIVNRTSLGDGYVQSYVHLAEDGSPLAIGVQIDQKALDTLPKEPHDGATCWDQNGDGVTDPTAGECSGGHERILFYPTNVKGLPFKFIQFNWQTYGHAPMHVFDTGHFDLHFFVQDYISRNFIRTGPCGTQIDCNDFQKAIKDVPAPYAPIGYSNVQAVAGRMGNHLLDLDDPVFHDGPLTQTFAFGSYDGHISYYEPVVLVSWLAEHPVDCKPIPAPPAMEISGYYPRQYCTRYRADRGDYTMSMEAFEYREAPADADGGSAEPMPAADAGTDVPDDSMHDHMEM